MTAATVQALARSHIVSNILHHLSDMKYKDRRQYGPDQPVEFLEFRPTLVPSILVNRLWADEGTSVLWKRYPHLPALKTMAPARRQYYANKVQILFSIGPPPDSRESLEYLDDLVWPNLKSLELEVDLERHGAKYSSMMHAGLEHLEISGFQSGGSAYFIHVAFASLLAPCQHLKSIRFTPEASSENALLHSSDFYTYLDTIPSITSVEIKATHFFDKDNLFTRLSQRAGLEGLEMNLDPGLSLLPQISGPSALPLPFASLKRLSIMCYPEIALALPSHLHSIEELQFEICRVPNQPAQDSDFRIIEDVLGELSHCPRLRLLKIGLGAVAADFPSFRNLPKLGGAALVNLSTVCPKLEDINIFSADPSALDVSDVSSEQFDAFCCNLPLLTNISLKMHPSTASSLEMTALQSLGAHCPNLEIVRLKLAFQLPSLPAPSSMPQITIISPPASDETLVREKRETSYGSDNNLGGSTAEPSPEVSVPPLFPRLKHLAISRPNTPLSTVNDAFPVSSTSAQGHPTDIIDHELEEELVRTWAHPLLTHFPRLEILEAWGDWKCEDNEPLNYFLPTEELLASTWEFLSGTEQDLWEDDGIVEEEENWVAYESGTDWDAASYVEELSSMDGKLQPFEEEPEGLITPGRTFSKIDFFEHPISQAEELPLVDILPSHDYAYGQGPSYVPTDELANVRIM